jgi:hypothetical protein
MTTSPFFVLAPTVSQLVLELPRQAAATQKFNPHGHSRLKKPAVHRTGDSQEPHNIPSPNSQKEARNTCHLRTGHRGSLERPGDTAAGAVLEATAGSLPGRSLTSGEPRPSPY